MWKWKPTRREVLRGMGTLAGMGALGMIGCGGGSDDTAGGGDAGGSGAGGGGGGTDGAAGGGGVPDVGGVRVRPDVMSSEGQAMLDLYRAAIEVMQGRPDDDPTSWRAQADIHLDHCPHGNAFFLPWHRAYLQYFEQIVRAAAGDDSFVLPFWDWTSHPTLPPAFWQGVLNDPSRSIAQNQAVPSWYVGQTVIDDILQISDFQTFASAYASAQRENVAYGRLEGTPHNGTHGTIGGDMATYLSPLDPIFWLHHCNVDRLWALWNRDHANGTDANWLAFTFDANFVEPDGGSVSPQVDQLLDTEPLGYRYPGTGSGLETVGEPRASESVVVASAQAAVDRTIETGETVRVAVRLDESTRSRLDPALEGAERPIVRLTVGGVEKPSAALPVNVYVGADETPTGGPDDRSYVATFTFFPTGEGSDAGHHAGGELSYLFDVSDKLGDLAGDDELDVYIEVDDPPVSLEGGERASIRPKTVLIEVLSQEV